MSYPNRNVGRNAGVSASYVVPQEDFFVPTENLWRHGNNVGNNAGNNAGTPEAQANGLLSIPSWTIRLNRIPAEALPRLSAEIDRHNMKLSQRFRDRDVVFISSNSPNNNLDENTLMVLVRRYAPNAQII